MAKTVTSGYVTLCLIALAFSCVIPQQYSSSDILLLCLLVLCRSFYMSGGDSAMSVRASDAPFPDGYVCLSEDQ